MKNILFITLALTFIACASSLPNFNTMNDAEIAAYNRKVGTWNQVMCREESHIRSRIPRRRCLTRIAWQQDVISDVGQVGTASSGQDQIIVN
ncbi:MAG: hypothetical protein VB960_05570 [Pseudohongiellaceae bacterium]